MISKSPEDYRYYEDRLKFLRDEEGKLLAAREEGQALGIEKGKQEGRQEGKQEGLELGMLAGRIQVLQELLGDSVTKDDKLSSLGLEELNGLVDKLQQRLRSRDA